MLHPLLFGSNNKLLMTQVQLGLPGSVIRYVALSWALPTPQTILTVGSNHAR